MHQAAAELRYFTDDTSISSVLSKLDLFHDREDKTLLSRYRWGKMRSLASAAAWNWAATSLTMHRDSD